MAEKRWADMERHLRLHRHGPAPKASYPILLTAEQLDLAIEAVQAMDRRAEPHDSEWRVPTAGPADDCSERRAEFVWSDLTGQWDMVRWLPTPPEAL